MATRGAVREGSAAGAGHDAAVVAHVRERVAAVLGASDRPVLLAVSGGMDSMTLLDAAAASERRDRLAGVATFDHATGAHARRAVTLVRESAARLGLPVVAGRARRGLIGTEAAWRAARWTFLREHADGLGARVATAHTRDDQVETVVMRVLRGAGARGLAGLAARDGDVLRPLLEVRRGEVEAYAGARALAVADDPSNRARAHLRNRIRLDLLPALERARPGFADAMLAIGARAAECRSAVDALADALCVRDGAGRAFVAGLSLREYDPEAIAILWPAIAARAGVTLDRRGTRRLTAFTMSARAGAVMPLSGGARVERARSAFRIVPPPVASANGSTLRGIDAGAGERVPDEGRALDGGATVVVGGFTMRPDLASGAALDRDDPWRAMLPADARLVVRAWRPGDRMRAPGGNTARRVKRYLSDAHVPAADRREWPVVLADDEIVWIPGVRRADAATDRSGRPGLPYLCDRSHV